MPHEIAETLPQPLGLHERLLRLIGIQKESKKGEIEMVEPSESPAQHKLDKLDVREISPKAVSKAVEHFLDGIRSRVGVIVVGRNRHHRQAVEAVISNHPAVENCEWEPDYGIERRPAAIINLASND